MCFNYSLHQYVFCVFKEAQLVLRNDFKFLLFRQLFPRLVPFSVKTCLHKRKIRSLRNSAKCITSSLPPASMHFSVRWMHFHQNLCRCLLPAYALPSSIHFSIFVSFSLISLYSCLTHTLSRTSWLTRSFFSLLVLYLPKYWK